MKKLSTVHVDHEIINARTRQKRRRFALIGLQLLATCTTIELALINTSAASRERFKCQPHARRQRARRGCIATDCTSFGNNPRPIHTRDTGRRLQVAGRPHGWRVFCNSETKEQNAATLRYPDRERGGSPDLPAYRKSRDLRPEVRRAAVATRGSRADRPSLASVPQHLRRRLPRLIARLIRETASGRAYRPYDGN